MSYQKYNVALIPSEAVGLQAIEMSHMLASHGGRLVLGSTEAYPHVSLYHVPLDPEKVEAVIETLRKTLAEIGSAPLKQNQYRSHDNGFVDVAYEKDEYLLMLHRALLQSLEPFWAREVRDKENQADISSAQQTSLSQYGWDAAADLFDPHLTFSRLAEPNKDVVAEMRLQNFSFVSDLVGLFELGENGVCIRCLAIFELQKK